MLNILLTYWKALNLYGKAVQGYLLGVIIANTVWAIYSLYNKEYLSSVNHILLAISVLTTSILLGVSVINQNKAKKMRDEAIGLHNDNYENKRMALYEKLLETKEKEIQ